MDRRDESPCLELKNIVKNFGGLCAVNKVTFRVAKGDVISVIGPNGAGKTTLLNLISGVLPLTEGEIWFKGQRINGLSPSDICSFGIARTFQDMQLFTNMSVIENVMVGCHSWSRASFFENMFRLGRTRKEEKEIFERAMEKLSLVGLEKKAFEAPLSLPLRDRKLVGMARALAAEPELLLLDEPAGGLNIEEIRELCGSALKLNKQGLTILFIEHRMEIVADISKRVIVMNFGNKIAEGTFEEIRRNNRVVDAYLGERVNRRA